MKTRIGHDLTFGSIIGIGLISASQITSAGDLVFIVQDEFGGGATIPLAWGDYDADGDHDILIGNYFGQANNLYVNGRGAVFTQQGVMGTGLTFAVAWADFDNDGDLDLVVGNNGQNWLFVADGKGGFEQQNQFGMLRTVGVAWGDYDNDGDLDLALGNGILGVAQQNYLYRNDGEEGFVGLPQFGIGQSDSVAWGDYDNDGDLDLAVGNGGFGFVGQNYLYINEGGGNVVEQAQFGIGDTSVVAWADANNDGWLDLAVGNWANGQDMLYLNDGKGGFVPMPAFGARDANTLAWGDADLDGDLDLVVGNGDFASADQNYLYLNDGTGSFAEQRNFGLGSTDSVAWADFDQDGDLDLAVGNEHSPTQNELWVNQLDSGAYLQLRLVGLFDMFGDGYSNRNAVGAQVAVYAAGHSGDSDFLRGFQQVQAKGGFSSQNAIDLTFGLPLDEAVDVVINWPGSAGQSIVQKRSSVGVGQRITVLETRPGDIDGNGVVGASDLLILLANWGSCAECGNCPADLDGNCTVGASDLLILLVNWG